MGLVLERHRLQYPRDEYVFGAATQLGRATDFHENERYAGALLQRADISYPAIWQPGFHHIKEARQRTLRYWPNQFIFEKLQYARSLGVH